MTDSKDAASRRDTAAHWYIELQEPNVSPDLWEAFLEWEKDPANAEAYREIEAALGVLDRTSLSSPASIIPVRRRKPVIMALVAAAAVFVIGAAATLAIGASVLTIQSPKPEPVPLVYATAIGEQETVRLVDGSVLILNTNTELSVRYSDTERLIQLAQGEALFEVAHSDRPFLVEAGGTRTTALGTEFDIHADGEAVSVTLIRGSVRVTDFTPDSRTKPPGAIPYNGLQEGIVLKPGERLDITPDADAIRSTIDPARVGTWREGLLQFDNVTLADAIAEMNRYSTIELRIDDPALASERISGTFPAGEQKDFSESLALYLPVQAKQTGNSIIISARLE